MNNGQTASLVGADVILVANGGLGKTFDELEINRRVFAQEGVGVRGVVLNKVLPEKLEMVQEKMGKLLRERCAASPHPYQASEWDLSMYLWSTLTPASKHCLNSQPAAHPHLCWQPCPEP